MNAYFISGLGADKRIFSRLRLNESINIIHIDWITPFKNESLMDYAERLSKVIDVNLPFALVGVSFGGMIVVEISKILNPVSTIIISSAVFSSDLPFLYRLAGKLNLVKFIPTWLLKSSNKLTQNFFFGTKGKSEKMLLGRIISDTDPTFLKWAIGSILSWRNEIKAKNLIHIHGNADRILYSKSAQPDLMIKNGTHFMVYQQADEISKIIDNVVLSERDCHIPLKNRNSQ
ncbi:alpha/beta hydrolase [Pedobacter frigidisoli]|uniref:Alpha/beta hydrolase n=1 Tax=Pedobacter frigidisoli TaxID=2530455 RepID=A0A4R0P2K3_9SPHI|nr:alpha/beta hydrolase [Pedobacter frigidisoli]TCD08228.1 alpha/beta hydrolase [Pedobacter frigidisoli]